MSYPPGASYRVSNEAVILMRRALGLKPRFRIQFTLKWAQGNPLFDWYNGLTQPLVESMQLRKEHEEPFFHEFVIFRLKGGSYWRIDRRQLPNEKNPLDCLKESGVEASDTIEEVPSFQDSLYSTSDCLIEIDFKKDVHLGLILRICRAIHSHQVARKYTVLRYNCYFFAQTLILCTACGASDWDGSIGLGDEWDGCSTWKSPNTSVTEGAMQALPEDATKGERQQPLACHTWIPRFILQYDWETLSRPFHSLFHASSLLRHVDQCKDCLGSGGPSPKRSLTAELNRLKRQLSEHWNRLYCEVIGGVYPISHRILSFSSVWAPEVEAVTEKAYRQQVEKFLEGIPKNSDCEVGLVQRLPDFLETSQQLLNLKRVCDGWEPNSNDWLSESTAEQDGEIKSALIEWEEGISNFFNAEINRLRRIVVSQVVRSCARSNKLAVEARKNSFDQHMSIKLDCNVLGVSDPDKLKGVNERLVSVHRHKQNKQKVVCRSELKLEASDIVGMQAYISRLIYEHGRRVERYVVTRGLSLRVGVIQSDIIEAMDVVWKALTLDETMASSDGPGGQEV